MLDRGCEVGLVAGVACDAIAGLDQTVAANRTPRLTASANLTDVDLCIMPLGLFTLGLNYNAYGQRLSNL